MKYYEDPILGKGRAADVSGGTGSADYVGGTRIAIAGETISFVNSATIQNVTGNSVTLEPDTAYKITATASAVTLNANVPAAGQWAYEGHAEIFVAGTGYIVTGANVVLANPLEPDAVNNCVLRFHDGTCIIDVEDHVYGYVVTSISGTTQGTLPYGITSATQEYIAFDATTNGSTIDLSGSTASSEKHVVGNGYSDTILTGSVDCGTSKFTVANLSLQNVVVNGGTMTLGDAFIPSGSTVAVSGGGLVVEKVSGNGGVIDLGGVTGIILTAGSVASASGVTIQSGYTNGSDGGNFRLYGATVYLNGSTVANGNATYGGAFYMASTTHLTLTNCTVPEQGTRTFYCKDNSVLTISGSTIATVIMRDSATVDIQGSNSVVKIAPLSATSPNTSVTISGGASINLTSSIAPGGGITVLTGGCTVNGNDIAAGTYTSIDSNGSATV